VLLAGCAGPALSSIEQGIRGGSDDAGDPAVAALVLAGTDPYCTATLVAPHTLLTAGHCDLTDMTAAFGADASAPAQSIAVTDAVEHPMYTQEGAPYDFALMKLASDPTGVEPVTLNGSALGSADVGAPIRHVGFGVTDDTAKTGEGTKRTVTYPITEVDPLLVYSGATGEQTCDGDSGGPGFVGDALAAVVSDGPNCDLDQPGYDDRVDAVEDWIIAQTSSWDSSPKFDNRSDDSGCAGAISPWPLALLYRRRRKRNAIHAAARRHHASRDHAAGS
jgi:V8-like Glu-specific endopeptidase